MPRKCTPKTTSPASRTEDYYRQVAVELDRLCASIDAHAWEAYFKQEEEESGKQRPKRRK